MSGYKFRRQHPFGDFILDFVCLEKMLVIEIDGGQHQENQASDSERTEKLAGAGFRVLRFWNNEVLGQLEAVKERIWMELQKTGDAHPHPNPLLEGEGAKEIENQDRRKGFGLPIEKPEDPKKVERLIDMFGKFPLDLTPENLSKMRGDEHNKHFSLVAKKTGLKET